MINLLPTAVVADAQLTKTKRRVQAGTTIVLVTYILLLAAIGGRSWYLSNQQTAIVAHVASLTTQVNGLAAVEANIRQQAERIKLINALLTSRVLLSGTAAKISGPEVVEWTFAPEGLSASVVGPSSQVLEDYAKGLADKFTTVMVDSLALQPDQNWRMELSVSGEKK